MWNTAGAQTNPLINAILAEVILPVADSNCRFRLHASASVVAVVVVEHRNVANDTTIKSHIYPIAAMSPLDIDFPYGNAVLAGERIRVRLNAAITGQVQASIFTDY